MKIKLIFRWYDFWMGLFWDEPRHRLYLFLIPMIGIRFSFKFKCTKCGKWQWNNNLSYGVCLEHWENGEIGK